MVVKKISGFNDIPVVPLRYMYVIDKGHLYQKNLVHVI
jgi:hypothetical protein